MDKTDLKELISRLTHKVCIKHNDTFEMFGSTYVAIKTEDKNPCERCVFQNANCNFNVDIPSCNNGVHFRLVEKMCLSLYNKEQRIGTIEKIENNIVYLEYGKVLSVYDMYNYDYTIKPTLQFK